MISLKSGKQLTVSEFMKLRVETAKTFTNWRKSKGYNLICGRDMAPGLKIKSISVTIDPETQKVVRVFSSLNEVINIKPFITPRGFTNYELKYKTEAGYVYKTNLPGYKVKATLNKPAIDHPVDDIGCIKYHFYSNE